MSTFGFAARAVIKTVGGNDPSSLRFFGVKFTSPVKPGDKLETQIWEVGPGPEGTTEVTFITKNVNTEKVGCLMRFRCIRGLIGVTSMNRLLLAAELHMSGSRQFSLSYEPCGTCVVVSSLREAWEMQIITFNRSPASYSLEYLKSVLVVKYCET